MSSHDLQIHFTMRNSATNQVEPGMVIVSPAAQLADIIRFESTVQSVSVRGNAMPKSDDAFASWTSMGYQPTASSSSWSPMATAPAIFGSSSAERKTKNVANEAGCWYFTGFLWYFIPTLGLIYYETQPDGQILEKFTIAAPGFPCPIPFWYPCNGKKPFPQGKYGKGRCRCVGEDGCWLQIQLCKC